MKRTEKHIPTFLFSLVLLLAMGNAAFAAEMLQGKKESLALTEFQKEQQKPFVFNELSIGKVSQTVSQNEYLGLGLFGTLYSNQNFSFVRVSSANPSSYFLKDKREFIFRYLFPFHFFW